MGEIVGFVLLAATVLASLIAMLLGWLVATGLDRPPQE